MAHVTDQQIAQFAADAGFSGPDLETAVAVAIAESKGDAAAIGDVELQDAAFGPSVGLWQIRSVNPGYGNAFDQAHRNQQQNMDPATNAANAYAIQQQKGWREWSTYKDGLHNQYLDRARAAASGLSGAPRQNQTPTPTPRPSGQGQGQGGSQGFLGELQKLMESIRKLVDPAEKLNRAGQAAGRAAASSAAFGKVHGSSAAHQTHANNTRKYGEHACRGGERVRTQGEDIQRSANDYEAFSQRGASDIDRAAVGVREDMISPPVPPNVA